MLATHRSNEESYWQAVLSRDRRFDGVFVFGVKSTGIYCRPSCPARRPIRKNVAFYSSNRDAETAGLRACLRCKPERPADSIADKVTRACRFIDNNLDRRITLSELGAEVGAAPHYLQRSFKRIIGITPHQYAVTQRMASFKNQVRKGATVTHAMYDAGFGSSSRLYERASTGLGMTPATYRKGGAGMKVAFTITASPLNRLLVAATEKGICAVSLGDSDSLLVQTLEREFPKAEIRRDDRGLGRLVRFVLQSIENNRVNETLPLDVGGTAFQRRVWAALQQIPRGSTASYEDVARTIKRPGAARAVARACATNRVAVLIPCHRVVRRDGNLGGYRWGADRKRALLERERSK
ncbi:MAG TPA: bifunctional DNA-binding transcriptional regulator/O6-methylguanine-DNA methyltransferase Ada [Blastocatellia bacterium]|nr:bifunctional DNA-binding transcriptional regulator/O6-methylguanine-DNA methyltransferase Ada [Blastocatellia bacterium]